MKSVDEMRASLKKKILNTGIVWGQGKNPHGKTYKWTTDSKLYFLDPEGLQEITQLMLALVEKYDADAVGGLTLASHILTSSIMLHSSKKYDGFLIRKEHKLSGLRKDVEGPSIKGKKVVILDDSINRGGRATHAIDAAEKRGATVVAFVALIDLNSEDSLVVKQRGIPLERVFMLSDLGMDPRVMPKDMGKYELKWRYGPVNTSDYNAAKSTPLVVDSKIYVGSDRGAMLCINRNGNLLWKFETDIHPQGVHASPICVENLIIFAGYDGGVYAVDKDDGKLVWKNKVSSYIGGSAVFDKDTGDIYIGLENRTGKSTLAVLDAKTGVLKWELSTNSHVVTWPAFTSDRIIFGSNDNNIYCCDKKGKILWMYRTRGCVKRGILIDGDVVYVCSTDGYLYKLTVGSGKEIWKKKLGGKLFGEPLLVDGTLYVGSFSGQVTALDPESSEVKWFFMTERMIQSNFAYHDGNIFFGSYDGSIYCVDAKEGTLEWTFVTGGPVSSTPVIDKDRILVSSNDSNLYSFQAKGQRPQT